MFAVGFLAGTAAFTLLLDPLLCREVDGDRICVQPERAYRALRVRSAPPNARTSRPRVRVHARWPAPTSPAPDTPSDEELGAGGTLGAWEVDAAGPDAWLVTAGGSCRIARLGPPEPREP